MATVAQWTAGARPRTLGAAIAPVAAGTGVASAQAGIIPLYACLALAVALALQIGVNYANDYSDGVRGTDDARVGPVRLVGQGLAAPAAVKRMAIACFLLAAIIGFLLVALVGQWWLLLVGAAAIAAGWLYTGGPRPYGYLGLGEIFVFVFFGIVPVLGTAYVQTLSFSSLGLWAALGVGALACAVLVSNNLRDRETDAASGKHTLAVRLGDRGTRIFYIALLVFAYVMIVLIASGAGAGLAWAWLALLTLPLAVRAALVVAEGARERALIVVLQLTGLLTLAYGVLLGIGLVLSR
jgi:1,4-dihydroxy-2-naphthoate polyprenyltransferase